MRDVQAAGGSPLTDGAPGTGGPPASELIPPYGRKRAVLLAVAAVVLVADLVTKLWVVADYSDGRVTTLIPDVLDIRLTRNPGAAFGLGGGATVLFALVAVAVIVVIVRTAARLRSLGWAISLGLLLGGAVGNLGDRIFRDPAVLRGHVVDWIHLHHWPIFNLADSAIVVGGILAVLLAASGRRPDGTREPRESR